MNLDEYIDRLPKVELHVHLEGSISPGTLLELAARNSVSLPSKKSSEFRDWFSFGDFTKFKTVYRLITSCLQRTDDYELVAYEFGAQMASQNIKYAEVTFSPSTHLDLGVSEDVWWEGLVRGRDRAVKEFNIDFQFIFDIVRHTEAHKRAVFADVVTSMAIDRRNDGVVALGLGGLEDGYPPRLFQKWFDQATRAGLKSVPHAGEHLGPDSVWDAIRILHAQRIGHGVRSIEDPNLVDYLARNHIPVEICPTSNLRLGVFPSLEMHPLRLLYSKGITVTVNSDDPALFHTSLTDELKLGTKLGFGVKEIDEFVINSVKESFLPESDKQVMEATFRTEMEYLRSLLQTSRDSDRPKMPQEIGDSSGLGG